MLISSSHLLLDACCVFNLLASGYFLDIVISIPAQVLITQTVWEQELIKFERFEPRDKEQLDESINKEIIQIVDFQSEEETDLFVNYAAILGDDGESATGAIAIPRNWALATDDKTAVSFFQREAPNLEIVSTPAIVRFWSESADVDSPSLKSVLLAIRTRGRYGPGVSHPLYSWWENSINS